MVSKRAFSVQRGISNQRKILQPDSERGEPCYIWIILCKFKLLSGLGVAKVG